VIWITYTFLSAPFLDALRRNPMFLPFLNHAHDLVLGSIDPFGWFGFHLPNRDRSTHTYVIGLTGKGKSKLLEHLLFQDIVAGQGCGLLDPHSDLADDLLGYLARHGQLAERHWSRIVYFDPSRTDWVLPFNVLRSPTSPYATAVNIVEAMRRTWPKALEEAPRFANICLAAILTLMDNHLTLVELPRLLTNAGYRHELLKAVSDPELVSFWKDRYERWGREQPLMIESVLNKVTAFTFNPTLRLILGARENRLDFQRFMDEGKVLIADLGRCDGETRRLLGSLLVTGMEQAALSRKDAPSRARRPFYFYLDEFQDFVANEGSAMTLAQILSEARKFGLHLTLAHQTLGQMTSTWMRAALGNIQTKIVFGVDREDAEVLARKLFQADGEEVKHEVADAVQQERSHPLFYALSEQWEKATRMIQTLRPRWAFVGTPEGRIVRIKTLTMPDRGIPETQLLELKRHLVERSGQPRQQVEAEISARRIESGRRTAREGEVVIRERVQRHQWGSVGRS
jgi:TraM recognition site of TraD and TraG